MPISNAPWRKVDIVTGKFSGCIGIKPVGYHSPALCFLNRGREDIQISNANLIVAAPELLMALKDCKAELSMWLDCCSDKEIKDSFQGMADAVNKAEKAISKAKGTT